MPEFKEKWMATWNESRKSRSQTDTALLKPEEIEPLMEALVRHAFDRAFTQMGRTEMIQNNGLKNSMLADLRKASSNSDGTFNNVLLRVRQQTNRLSDLLDLRLQETRADQEEKRRLLGYRIATAISMGLILLATYWVADYFDIPMPLRMISIPTQ